MDKTFWTALQPILAQGARDGLRLIGASLMTHGFIANGAGVEAFIGAGMTLAGLFWGWWTTSGYIQAGALLQKLTASHNHLDAMQKAQAMPAASPIAVAETIAKMATPLMLAVTLALLALPQGAMAQGLKTPQQVVRDVHNALNPNAPAVTGNPLGDIIGALDVKLLPDLQYALKLANASGSKVTGPCYQAWIDIINVRQKAVEDDQTPPQALPMPDPHLVTDFEKLVELRNSLQPDSEFMIKCSPVASMVKKDIVGFIGIVISGGAGLATLVPGI